MIATDILIKYRELAEADGISLAAIADELGRSCFLCGAPGATKLTATSNVREDEHRLSVGLQMCSTCYTKAAYREPKWVPYGRGGTNIQRRGGGMGSAASRNGHAVQISVGR
jgi:hypothetical protein